MISAGERGETQVRGHVRGEETMDVKPRIVLSFGDPPGSVRTKYRGRRLCLQGARSQNPRYTPVRAGPPGCRGRAPVLAGPRATPHRCIQPPAIPSATSRGCEERVRSPRRAPELTLAMGARALEGGDGEDRVRALP